MHHSRLRPLLCATSLAAATLVALAPTEADACGGTFCDGQVPGPQQMPVDQTGENILFAIDDGQVEAHIQIQYEGDPERFGWIIPVQAIPDVEAGSQTLFDNLMAATVPTFTLDQQFESCNGGSGASFSLCAFAKDAGTAEFDSNGTGQGEDGDDGDPEVVKRGFAGAFQYDVLQGGSVQGVVDWLDQAGYAQDPDAPPILQQYLDEDFLFVAIKLRAGVGVDEIHPVVIRYAGMEPCVPIRLTQIAAVPDMGIRTFFLGDDRVAPRNYQHVELNPLKFDWLGIANGTGTLYNAAVSLGVDEAEDGHAFVTEYAGTSAVVSQANLRDLAWDSEAFIDLNAVDVVNVLEQQGLMDCSDPELGCVYNHPLVAALLADFVPVPNGIDADAFYTCLECYAGQIDQGAWDGAAFAATLEERIIVPGEHAIDILNGHDYLTRMFTTISPEEMTEDPLFFENPDLPEVSNQFFATRWFACEGPDWIELDDGRIVALDAITGQLPGFEDQPYALEIQDVMPVGAPVVVVDNGGEIDASLDNWNESQRQLERGGCGCRSAGLSPEGLLFYGTVFGFAFVQRRRRR